MASNTTRGADSQFETWICVVNLIFCFLVYIYYNNIIQFKTIKQFFFTTNKQGFIWKFPKLPEVALAKIPGVHPPTKLQRATMVFPTSPLMSPCSPPSMHTHTSGHARELESPPSRLQHPGLKSWGGSPLASKEMMAARATLHRLRKEMWKEAPNKAP